MPGAVRWLTLAVIVGCAPTESKPEPAPIPAPEQPASPAEPQPASEPAPTSEVVMACDERAIAAARTAVETAIAKGVDASVLADCEPEQIVCEAERHPLERGPSCVLVGYGSDDRWEIVIIPSPATGAPTRIEVWVDAAGHNSGRVNISGSTFGVLDGVTIEGHGEYASHTHGGAPARIGGATFTVENRRPTAIDLKLTGTRWLVDHSCELPRTERAKPKPAGLARGEDLVDGQMIVTIPAGAIETVSIGHQVQDAYMAYCDRFATAASFVIDRQAIEVIAEHHVIRREPLRDR
jgi:hypothetical protein